jgi:predicted lipoprotein with Yx(FWY)xxD motif
MEVTTNVKGSFRRPLGRIISTALVAGTVSATLFSMGSSGASTMSSRVSIAKSARLGTYLVSGKTLYTLSRNDCNVTCLKFWPALLLPKGIMKATAGPGVNGAKLGTVKIASGRQVTYGGKPLYFFVGDTKSGKVTGNKLKDRFGVWSIVTTAKPKSGGGVTTTTAPAGGGAGF